MVMDSTKFPPCSNLIKQAANKRKHVDPKMYTLILNLLREGEQAREQPHLYFASNLNAT